MRTIRIVVAMAVLCAGMMAGCARGVDGTPLATTRSVIQAVNDGDEALFVRTVDAGDFGGPETVREIYALQRDMLAMPQRFAELYGRAEAEKFQGSGLLGICAFADAADSIEVEQTDGQAVATVGSAGGTMYLVSQDGRWRVTLRSRRFKVPQTDADRKGLAFLRDYRVGVKNAHKKHLTRKRPGREPADIARDIHLTIIGARTSR